MANLFDDPMFLAEQQLGRLAIQFRRCRDDQQRQEIVQRYERAVQDLIETGSWRRVPPPENQLPDELMPRNYFEYWDGDEVE